MLDEIPCRWADRWCQRRLICWWARRAPASCSRRSRRSAAPGGSARAARTRTCLWSSVHQNRYASTRAIESGVGAKKNRRCTVSGFPLTAQKEHGNSSHWNCCWHQPTDVLLSSFWHCKMLMGCIHFPLIYPFHLVLLVVTGFSLYYFHVFNKSLSDSISFFPTRLDFQK